MNVNVARCNQSPVTPNHWVFYGLAVLVHGILLCIPIHSKTVSTAVPEAVQLVISAPVAPPDETRFDAQPLVAPIQRFEQPKPKPVPVKPQPKPRAAHATVPPQIASSVSRPEPAQTPQVESPSVNETDAPIQVSDFATHSASDGEHRSALGGGTGDTAEDAGNPIESSVGSIGGPQFIDRVMPQYPRIARRMGVEGTVVLQLSIDATGRLTEARVVKPAGHGFDEEALRSVRESRFSPALKNGKPVACIAQLQIRFQLDN